MKKGGKKAASWYVYIVSCSDGTLYTGITTDLERRMAEHNSEKGGARYTRSRQPVRLVYRETAESRAEAARREYRIRRTPAAQKRALVAASPATKTLLARRRRGAEKGKKLRK